MFFFYFYKLINLFIFFCKFSTPRFNIDVNTSSKPSFAPVLFYSFQFYPCSFTFSIYSQMFFVHVWVLMYLFLCMCGSYCFSVYMHVSVLFFFCLRAGVGLIVSLHLCMSGFVCFSVFMHVSISLCFYSHIYPSTRFTTQWFDLIILTLIITSTSFLNVSNKWSLFCSFIIFLIANFFMCSSSLIVSRIPNR